MRLALGRTNDITTAPVLKLKLRRELGLLRLESALLEVDFKTQRLKTGDVAAGTSAGFRPLYTPNYCPGGRVSFDTHALHDDSLSVRSDEELTHNAGW